MARRGMKVHNDTLRLAPGAMLAPRVLRSAPRISETAIAAGSSGLGWIDRAIAECCERPATETRISSLVAWIRHARIGGPFWAGPPQWPASVRLAIKLD